MLSRIHHPTNKVAMYVLAGLKTSPDFMEQFRIHMAKRLELEGWMVYSELLFPYGNWHRPLLPQLQEIRKDMMLSRKKHPHSIGGRYAASAINASYTDGAILIIGHSAGGMAGIHAASILMETGFTAPSIVQIGSPKCRIPQALQASTLFIRAIDDRGRSKDAITRIGSWTGWERGRGGMPLRASRLYAPGTCRDIVMIGGHPDYFRASPAYVNIEGVSNLEMTTDVIWRWLRTDN